MQQKQGGGEALINPIRVLRGLGLAGQLLVKLATQVKEKPLPAQEIVLHKGA